MALDNVWEDRNIDARINTAERRWPLFYVW